MLSDVERSLNIFKNVQRVDSTFLLSKVLLGDVESVLTPHPMFSRRKRSRLGFARQRKASTRQDLRSDQEVEGS